MEEEKSYAKMATIAVACLILATAALAVGISLYRNPATAEGIARVGKDIAETINPANPTTPKPTRIIEVWEDEPTRCRNWRTCKSTKFSGTEQGGGAWLWKCLECKKMWLYPFKGRFLVGITDYTITFGPLPASRQVLSTPPGAKPGTPEIKPEPKRR